MKQTGLTLWFTGLSGAGKTTIAKIVEMKLNVMKEVRVQLLDGDILREVYNDLGFTKEDRISHIKRAVFIAKLLSQHGIIVLASFITPYHEMREYCREHIPNYIEIYVKCPLDECITRDVKGLYKKALAGQIEHFTGISDPYEEPYKPNLVIQTLVEEPEKSADKVIHFLRNNGYIRNRIEGEQ